MKVEIKIDQKVIDQNGNLAPLAKITLLNNDDFESFMAGYLKDDTVDFSYIIGYVNGHRLNVGLIHNSTKDTFAFNWGYQLNGVSRSTQLKKVNRHEH